MIKEECRNPTVPQYRQFIWLVPLLLTSMSHRLSVMTNVPKRRESFEKANRKETEVSSRYATMNEGMITIGSTMIDKMPFPSNRNSICDATCLGHKIINGKQGLTDPVRNLVEIQTKWIDKLLEDVQHEVSRDNIGYYLDTSCETKSTEK